MSNTPTLFSRVKILTYIFIFTVFNIPLFVSTGSVSAWTGSLSACDSGTWDTYLSEYNGMSMVNDEAASPPPLVNYIVTKHNDGEAEFPLLYNTPGHIEVFAIDGQNYYRFPDSAPVYTFGPGYESISASVGSDQTPVSGAECYVSAVGLTPNTTDHPYLGDIFWTNAGNPSWLGDNAAPVISAILGMLYDNSVFMALSASFVSMYFIFNFFVKAWHGNLK